MSGRLHGGRGQSTVEIALLLPLMLLFCIGIVDFGRVYYFDIVLTNTARVGIRAAADTRNSWDTVKAAVRAEAGASLVLPDGDIRLFEETALNPPTWQQVGSPGTTARVKGTTYRVTVVYTFTPIVGSLFTNGLFVNPFRTVTFNRSASMVAF